jgi:hypothetical protein
MIRLQLVSGEAKVVSNLSRTLGQHQINTSKFCIKFNEESLKLTIAGVLYYVYVFKKEGRDNYDLKLGSPSLKFLISELSLPILHGKKVLTLESLYDLYQIFLKLSPNKDLNVKVFLGTISSFNNLILDV